MNRVGDSLNGIGITPRVRGLKKLITTAMTSPARSVGTFEIAGAIFIERLALLQAQPMASMGPFSIVSFNQVCNDVYSRI